MIYNTLAVEIADRITVLTFNRTKALNVDVALPAVVIDEHVREPQGVLIGEPAAKISRSFGPCAKKRTRSGVGTVTRRATDGGPI